MCLKVLLLTFVVTLLLRTVSTQRQWVPPTTTAAEMWNPYTWYWPYAIAASEGYRQYFMNAQQITNQLYTQAYATNAFWWTNRPGGGTGGGAVGGAAGQAGSQAGQAAGQAGQTAGGAAGQAGQTAGGATGQAGQVAGQGGGQGGQTAGGTSNQATGQATGGNRPVANMSQGGAGWT